MKFDYFILGGLTPWRPIRQPPLYVMDFVGLEFRPSTKYCNFVQMIKQPNSLPSRMA